ncbi:MAG: hypothetical protein N2035_01600 [Chthoniobacterales bacterium]|nr:hypothetical protein [Chthoniobacterales bacterium]
MQVGKVLPWLFAVCFFLHSSCSNSSDAANAEACVRENLAALEKADEGAYLATLHPASPVIPSLLNGFRKLEQYPLSCQTEFVRWRGQQGEFGYVEVRQAVRSTEGNNNFPPKKIFGRYLLKKDNAVWKVWDIQTLDIWQENL